MHKNAMTTLSAEEIKIVYELAKNGLFDYQIAAKIGLDKSVFSKIKYRQSEVRKAVNSARADARLEIYSALQERAKTDKSAAYMQIFLNRDRQEEEQKPEFSENAKNVLASKTASAAEKMIALQEDYSNNIITTKTFKNACDAIAELDKVARNEQLDEIKKDVDMLLQQLKNK